MALRLKAIVCAVLPALLAISVAAEETVAGADRGYDTFNTKPEHKLGWTPTGFVADSRGTRHILPPSLSAAAPSSGCGCLLKPCDCPPDTDNAKDDLDDDEEVEEKEKALAQPSLPVQKSPCTENPCKVHEVCHWAGAHKRKCTRKPGFAANPNTDGSAAPLCDCNAGNNGGCGAHTCNCIANKEKGGIERAECICQQGFTLNLGVCVQNDPCDRCRSDVNAHCKFGLSFVLNTCVCSEGFEFNTNGLCEEIDPCLISLKPGVEEKKVCPDATKCVHTGPNKRTCKPECPKDQIAIPGSIHCKKFNPCELNNGGCHADAHCEAASEEKHGRKCFCRPPKVGDGENCIPPNIKGQCAIKGQCSMNGREDLENCKCKCQHPWEGTVCSVCPVRCSNEGVMPPGTCGDCDCGTHWLKPDCKVCNPEWPDSECPPGHGIVDTKACRCKCVAPWQGSDCTQCNMQAQDCKHGKFDASQCKCTCEDGWAGTSCDKCVRHVYHGGQRTRNCKSNCINLAEGPNCEVCKSECFHGGLLDLASCSCKQCPDPWTGVQCETCMLTTNDCIHGGYMDLAKCECVACEKMWSGARCDVCTRQVSLCLNDFEGWDDAQCACKCSAQFKGTFCEKKVCDKKPDCGHGGQWDPYQCKCLACDGLWGGEECNTCTISPTVCESKGGTLDAATCKCKDCANYWMGPTCGECAIKSCKNGNMVKAEGKSECRCKCDPPFQGGENAKGGVMTPGDRPTFKFVGCTEKNLKCLNGGMLMNGECVCNTRGGHLWQGDDCSKCDASCANGATLDSKNCKCVHCPEPWSGALCEKCHLDDTSCANGGHLDRKTCACRDCGGRGATVRFHTGDRCEDCAKIECANNGHWDKDKCKCKCDKAFDGMLCETRKCSGVCFHEGVSDMELCTCSKCKPEIKGANNQIKSIWADGGKCNKCALVDADCKNGGKVNPDTCECVGCELGWQDLLCDKCGLTASDCKNGGTLNHETCKCGCLPPSGMLLKDGPQWGGQMCDKCQWTTEGHCQHQSQLHEPSCTCKGCNPKAFEGDQCQFCPKVNKANFCGTKEQGELDSELCQCKCNSPWALAGDSCNECTLWKKSSSWRIGRRTVDPDKCGEGAESVVEETCSCKCKSNWLKDPSGKCSMCAQKPANCKEGSFVESTCTCTKCKTGWKGLNCEKCDITCGHCKDGRCTIKGCKCIGCATGWKGADCNEPFKVNCKVGEAWKSYDKKKCIYPKPRCTSQKGKERKFREVIQPAVNGGDACPVTENNDETCEDSAQMCDRPAAGCPAGSEYTPNFAYEICKEKTSERDVVVIIDKSGSMRGKRWDEAFQATDLILQTLQKKDNAGMKVVFFDGGVEETSLIKTPEDWFKVWKYKNGKNGQERRPGGWTNMKGALEMALLRKKVEGKPMSILMITDGAPSRPRGDPEACIVAASNKYKLKEDVKITFVQVGTDITANNYLNRLDTALSVAYNIVDKVSMSDISDARTSFMNYFKHWFACEPGVGSWKGCAKCPLGTYKASQGNDICGKCPGNLIKDQNNEIIGVGATTCASSLDLPDATYVMDITGSGETLKSVRYEYKDALTKWWFVLGREQKKCRRTRFLEGNWECVNVEKQK